MAATTGSGNAQMREMRRMAKSRKPEAEGDGTKKKPLLGAGKHSSKGNKEIPGKIKNNETKLKHMSMVYNELFIFRFRFYKHENMFQKPRRN